MKRQFLVTVSVAALSLALSLGAAQAQAPDSPQGAAPSAPNVQQSAPGGMTRSDGGAENMQQGDPKQGAGPAAAAPDNQDRERMGERSKKTGDEKNQPNRDAASDRDRGDKSAERDGPDGRDTRNSDTDRKSAESGDKDRMKNDRAAESRDDKDRKAGDRKGATAKIDADQKKKVRSYFSENKPRAKRIDKDRVSVSIGIGIPASIALMPVPPGIVVVAADCPLQYFVWGDDVVLVNSCSREVIDIIPNVG